MRLHPIALTTSNECADAHANQAGGHTSANARNDRLGETAVDGPNGDRASNGANIMKAAAFPPADAPAPVLNTAIASPVAPPVDPATAYYNLGAPKGQKAVVPVAAAADPVKTP